MVGANGCFDQQKIKKKNKKTTNRKCNIFQ